ncbi:MAG: RNA polymerase sigma factor [Armatimonadota bacterium]
MSSSDIELLRRYAATGDAQCFAELAARHRDLVYSAAARVLGHGADAEDVAQECLVRLARDPGRITTSVAAWLHRTAVNAAIDTMRRDRSRREREQAAASIGLGHDGDASWEDIRGEMDLAIDRLPGKLREPIVLHFLQGKKQAAVAGQLGVSQTTVSFRLKEGIERLRGHLRRAGVAIPAVGLAGLLSTRAAEAAPAPVIARLGNLARLAVKSGPPPAGPLGSLLAKAGAGWQAKLAGALVVASVGGLAVREGVTRHSPSGPESPAVAGDSVATPAVTAAADQSGPGALPEEAPEAQETSAPKTDLPSNPVVPNAAPAELRETPALAPAPAAAPPPVRISVIDCSVEQFTAEGMPPHLAPMGHFAVVFPLLQDMGLQAADISGDAQMGQIDLGNTDLLIIRRLTANTRASLATNAAAMADFVAGGGTIMQETPADEEQQVVDWLPESLGVMISEEDFSSVYVEDPDHPLFVGPSLLSAGEIGRIHQITPPPAAGGGPAARARLSPECWESYLAFKNAKLLITDRQQGGPHPDMPAAGLLEYEHGNGRILLSSMRLFGAYAAPGTDTTRDAVTGLVGNLVDYARLVRAGQAPPVEPLATFPW